MDAAYASRVGVAGHPDCPLYVAESSLCGAGKGVFARADIPARSIVTPYDGSLFRGILSASPTSSSRVIDYALQLPCEVQDARSRRAGVKYERSLWYILGEEPRRGTSDARCMRRGRVIHVFDRCQAMRTGKVVGRGFGHLLNDAIHEEVTGKKNNCRFVFIEDDDLTSSPVPRTRAFIQAETDIQAGSELFVSYHVSYWAGRARSPAMRLLPDSVRLFCTAMAHVSAFLGKRDLELDAYLGKGLFGCIDKDTGAHLVKTLGIQETDGKDDEFSILELSVPA